MSEYSIGVYQILSVFYEKLKILRNFFSFWPDILVALLNFFDVILASKLEKVVFRLEVIFFADVLLDFKFITAKNDENRQFASLLWLADPDRANLH